MLYDVVVHRPYDREGNGGLRIVGTHMSDLEADRLRQRLLGRILLEALQGKPGYAIVQRIPNSH